MSEIRIIYISLFLTVLNWNLEGEVVQPHNSVLHSDNQLWTGGWNLMTVLWLLQTKCLPYVYIFALCFQLLYDQATC